MTSQEYHSRAYLRELYDGIFQETGRKHLVRENLARRLGIDQKELGDAVGKEEVVERIMAYQKRLVINRRAHFLSAAEELAKIVWPMKDILKIVDLILYGSVARGEENPNDLDLMFLHENPLLDRYQDLLKITPMSPKKALTTLVDMLNVQEISEVIKGTKVERLINEGMISANYMNVRYFSDLGYRARWNQQNENPNFARNVFATGFLWNPNANKYDTPAETKYRLSKPQPGQPLP